MKYVVIETERLLLRPLDEEDAEAVFAWASDAEVNRFLSYPLCHRVEDVRAWLKTAYQTETRYTFGFERKQDGRLIGSGAITLLRGVWKMGYNLRRDCWGQGYATEAAKAMLGYARDQLGARHFSAYHAVDNPASGRVMEKCGLHFDHTGEYAKTDGSAVFPAKFYTLTLPALETEDGGA